MVQPTICLLLTDVGILTGPEHPSQRQLYILKYLIVNISSLSLLYLFFIIITLPLLH